MPLRLLIALSLTLTCVGCIRSSRPTQVRVSEAERTEFLQLAADELAKHQVTGKLSDSSDVLAVSSIQGATHLAAGEIMTPENQVRPWSVTFHVSSFDNGAERVVQVVQVKADGRVVVAAPVSPVSPTQIRPTVPVLADPPATP